jgi:lipid-binding SYLF domain-containing protein
MNHKGMALCALIAILVVAWHPVASAQWQADPDDNRQAKAAKAIEKIKAKVERSHPFFDDAYAYAVWPGITRVAFGFGGAYGKGVVVEQMIVFFKDKESLESLQRGEMQFAGQAGVDVVTYGAAGTPTYNEGVAIIPLTNLGLMAEFSASGIKYNYKPYDE